MLQKNTKNKEIYVLNVAGKGLLNMAVYLFLPGNK